MLLPTMMAGSGRSSCWSSPWTASIWALRVRRSKLGKDGVRPLVAALGVSDTYIQEVVARSLGKIGYPHACAGLRELAQREGLLKPVADAATAALAACGGKRAVKKPVAELYNELAEKYYSRAESLNPNPKYDTANVWYLENGRVTYRAVPRVIFNERYAIQTRSDTASSVLAV